MEILYRSLHNLDLGMDNPVRKEIPSDFDSYIAEYIHFATSENKTSRMYSVLDHNTTVMHCIADLVADVVRQGNIVTDDDTVPLELSDSIARKLFVIEQTTQARMEHLTNLQRGSIVQALIWKMASISLLLQKLNIQNGMTERL